MRFHPNGVHQMHCVKNGLWTFFAFGQTNKTEKNTLVRSHLTDFAVRATSFFLWSTIINAPDYNLCSSTMRWFRLLRWRGNDATDKKQIFFGPIYPPPTTSSHGKPSQRGTLMRSITDRFLQNEIWIKYKYSQTNEVIWIRIAQKWRENNNKEHEEMSAIAQAELLFILYLIGMPKNFRLYRITSCWKNMRAHMCDVRPSL